MIIEIFKYFPRGGNLIWHCSSAHNPAWAGQELRSPDLNKWCQQKTQVVAAFWTHANRWGQAATLTRTWWQGGLGRLHGVRCRGGVWGGGGLLTASGAQWQSISSGSCTTWQAVGFLCLNEGETLGVGRRGHGSSCADGCWPPAERWSGPPAALVPLTEMQLGVGWGEAVFPMGTHFLKAGEVFCMHIRLWHRLE